MISPPLKILLTACSIGLTLSASAAGTLFGISALENAVYRIDTETGTAILVGETEFEPPEGVFTAPPTALASDSTRGIVWAFLNRSDDLYTVDLATGQITSVATLSFENFFDVGLAYDPNRDLLYLSDGSNFLYSFDPDEGEVNLIGNLESNFSGMAFDVENNILYGVTGQYEELHILNPTTAETTLVGNLGFNINTSGLAFDPETETLYLTERNQDSLYTVNTTTGAATLIGPLGIEDITGLTFLVEQEPQEITITSIARENILATIGFEGTSGNEYFLLKSLDLDFSNATTVDQVTLEDQNGIMEDNSAEEEAAFYRVSLAPQNQE